MTTKTKTQCTKCQTTESTDWFYKIYGGENDKLYCLGCAAEIDTRTLTPAEINEGRSIFQVAVV